MDFRETYKRLDNLCRDIYQSDKGISTYISDMEQIKYSKIKVKNFEADLNNLKKYKGIRNKIIHENGCDENNMCTINDVIWIEQFHQRILDQTDPLFLYRIEKEKHAQHYNKNLNEIVFEKNDNSKNQNTSIKYKVIATSFLIICILLYVMFVR